MSQKTIRNLIIFLLINAVLASYITVNYFIKSKTDDSPVAPVAAQPIPQPEPQAQAQPVAEASPPKVEEQVTAPVEPAATTAAASSVASASVSTSAPSAYKFPLPTTNVAEISPKEPVKAAVAATSVPTKIVETDSNKVCVEMGPFSAEEKNTMEVILSKNKQSDLAKLEKMQAHQLYWNLGKNKADAEKLFAKQKEGAMASAKFVLVQNKDKDWVVNIAKVHGFEDVAKKLLKDLEEKAQKINTGGTWEFVTLPEGYFFKFPDFKALKEVTVNSIDIILKAPKDPC